jgi:hypothetical protein
MNLKKFRDSSSCWRKHWVGAEKSRESFEDLLAIMTIAGAKCIQSDLESAKMMHRE